MLYEPIPSEEIKKRKKPVLRGSLGNRISQKIMLLKSLLIICAPLVLGQQ